MTAAAPDPAKVEDDELAELLYRTLAVDHDDDTLPVGSHYDPIVGFSIPTWGDARGECKRVADVLRAHGYGKRPTYTRQQVMDIWKSGELYGQVASDLYVNFARRLGVEVTE